MPPRALAHPHSPRHPHGRRTSPANPGAGRRLGFTLLEIVVVLLLVSLAAAVVAPSLLPPRAEPQGELDVVVERVRAAAALRGEMLHLVVDRSGAWHVGGAASHAIEPLARGHLPGTAWPAVTVIISPLGSCGLDTRSPDHRRVELRNPLTCTVTVP